MPVRRRLLTLLTCALLAAAAAPAAAQDDEFEPLSPEPPPGLGEEPTNGSNDGESEEPEAAKPELPATGAEPALMLLIGVGMISAGSGLRLRLIQR